MKALFKNLTAAFRIPELRMKLLFTAAMIAVIRLGSQMPVPGIGLTAFHERFEANHSSLGIVSAFTGGSFENFSIFALGITPYISASIVLQLLTVVFQRLEELQKEGAHGKKKFEMVTYGVAMGLALLESIAMTIGFVKREILTGIGIPRGILIVVCMTAGTAILMFLAHLITEKGIGNGISIILMVNILAGFPSEIAALFENFVWGKTIAKGILSAVIIIGIIVLMLIYVTWLGEGVHKIPIQYSQKTPISRTGGMSYLPIRVNLAGVIPVIFASTVFSIPQLISTMTGNSGNGGLWTYILRCSSSGNWFNWRTPIYTVGFLIYAALIYFFAFYYTSITFNPIEMAENIRVQGGTVPGIRPGKPTEEYLRRLMQRLLVIGTSGLLLAVAVPDILCAVTGADVSFGGTSIIIVAGVAIETAAQIETYLQARHHSGFLGREG